MHTLPRVFFSPSLPACDIHRCSLNLTRPERALLLLLLRTSTVVIDKPEPRVRFFCLLLFSRHPFVLSTSHAMIFEMFFFAAIINVSWQRGYLVCELSGHHFFPPLTVGVVASATCSSKFRPLPQPPRIPACKSWANITDTSGPPLAKDRTADRPSDVSR